MADVTISLLTPISIRLSWSGSGDFEVWWKSDHPAGQEYVPLATVTGTSYDVGALSWTTTYYFKVRQYGGAFGDPVQVFVCCGQAVIIPPGPSFMSNEYWQQMTDVDGDTVVFVPLPYSQEGGTKTSAEMLFYDISSDVWTYKSQVPSDIYNIEWSVNLRDARVFFYNYTGIYENLIFTYYDDLFVRKTFDLGSPMEFFSSTQDMVINDSGRIVLSCYQGFVRTMGNGYDSISASLDPGTFLYYLTSANHKTMHVYWRAETVGDEPGLDFALFGSYTFADGVDNGNGSYTVTVPFYPIVFGHNYFIKVNWVAPGGTEPPGWYSMWSNEIKITTTIEGVPSPHLERYFVGNGMTMYVRISYDNGETFGDPIALFDSFGYGFMGMAEAADDTIWFIVDEFSEESSQYIMYKIYKYIVGSPVSLIKTINTDADMYYTDVCRIFADGETIVAMYPYSDLGSGVTRFWMSISSDNGVSWEDKAFNPGFDPYGGLQYKLTISNGNIIIYTWDDSDNYYLLFSDDDGDSWTSKIDFSTYDGTFQYSWLRSDGNTVVFGVCHLHLEEVDPTPLGFFLSLDAGNTFGYIVNESTLPNILVPA